MRQAGDDGLEAHEILERLRARGAVRLERVVLRPNRSTLWSLTSGRTVLNLHTAYRHAPDEIIDAFALLVRPGVPPDVRRVARRRVATWPGVTVEIRRIRAAHRRRTSPAAGVGECCATPAQRVYLHRLYTWLNRTRFDGLLPPVVPLRLSRRFTRRLGQFVPALEGGRRTVGEIALAADLILAENDAERIDTLLHEMAHAANYLVEGEVGHGPRWRAWARRVGCRDRATCSAPIHRRQSRAPSRRVPPLPPGWRSGGEKDGSQARPRRRSVVSTTASAVIPNSS